MPFSQEYFQVIFPSSGLPRMVCLAHHHNSEAQVVAVPQKLELLLVRRFVLPPAVRSRLPHMFCICQDRSGPRFFFDGESFLHPTKELLHAKRCPQRSSGRLLPGRRPRVHTVYLCFALLHTPFIVAIPAKVNRVRCASFFCHMCRNVEELEAFCSTRVVTHLQGPTWLAY